MRLFIRSSPFGTGVYAILGPGTNRMNIYLHFVWASEL